MQTVDINIMELPIDRFEKLLKTEKKYEILISHLANTAKLSYDKSRLQFDDELLCGFFKSLEPVEYCDCYRNLRNEEEHKNDVQD